MASRRDERGQDPVDRAEKDERLTDEQKAHPHYSLAGAHDLADLSELKEHYQQHEKREENEEEKETPAHPEDLSHPRAPR